MIRFERCLAAGDSNHGANAVGTRTRAPTGGFYAVECPSETSMAVSTP
ncbi:MAG: hypothetical protein IJ066_10290 [Bacteroidaceae bacterium]|nr:hypothetical protein [Bacteroidaceae bacterium]